MTSMPIRTMRPPSSLAGQTNGSVDLDLLRPVDRTDYPIWYMAALPARGMLAMHAAILGRFGVQMSSVGRGRSFATQYSTFLQRHDPVSKAVYDNLPSSGAKRRFWPAAVSRYGLSSQYWRLKPGSAAAAVPGTSPHGLWCADDMALPDDADVDTSPEGIGERPDILQWMYQNEMEFGFAHSLLSEPWHVQWCVADVIPARVLAYEASIEHTPTTPTPEVPRPTPQPAVPAGAALAAAATEGDDMLQVLGNDDNHNEPTRWVWNGLVKRQLRNEAEYAKLVWFHKVDPTTTLEAPLWMSAADLAAYADV